MGFESNLAPKMPEKQEPAEDIETYLNRLGRDEKDSTSTCTEYEKSVSDNAVNPDTDSIKNTLKHVGLNLEKLAEYSQELENSESPEKEAMKIDLDILKKRLEIVKESMQVLLRIESIKKIITEEELTLDEASKLHQEIETMLANKNISAETEGALDDLRKTLFKTKVKREDGTTPLYEYVTPTKKL